MNFFYRSFATIVISFLYINALHSQPLTLTRVTPSEGVGVTATMCITEDCDGLIWFGTNNGLFRYDSKEIVRYAHSSGDENSIPINNINSLLSDSDGRLLVATENGIALYNRDLDNFKKLRLSDSSQVSIGKDVSYLVQSDQDYYLLDNRGVARFDRNFGSVEYIEIGTGEVRRRMLNKDKQGNLWVVLQNGEIYRKQSHQADFLLFGSTNQDGYCRSFLADDNAIWVGYDDKGIICLDYQGKIIKQYNIEGGFISNNIRSIINAGDNKVFVATYLGLVTIQDFEVVSVANSLIYNDMPHSSIWSLYKDRNDNTWIGTWLGGLCFHSNHKHPVHHINPLSHRELTSRDVITSFAIAPDSTNIWFTTETGYLATYHQPSNTITKEEIYYGGERVGNIQYITFDKKGKMWIGTRGNGVLYKDSGARRFAKFHVPSDEGLQTLSILPLESSVWLSYYQMGVITYDPKTREIKQYKRDAASDNTIGDNHIRKMLADYNGDIWFATAKGLTFFNYEEQQFTTYLQSTRLKQGLSSQNVNTIACDGKGNIWVGTSGGGLNKLDVENSEFSHFTTRDGLLGDEVYSIVVDDSDNLWLATENGICKFNTTTNQVLTFGNAEGMFNNKFVPNAAIKAPSGAIYFGGTNGFVYFNPDDIMLCNPIVPTPIITRFHINNQEIKSTVDGMLQQNINDVEHIRLSHTQNSFSFNFVSNNFINPDKNSFKYRLKGFDHKWIEADMNSRGNFTNIPYGSYTFELMCANNDGVWSEEIKVVEIEIIPPVYLRWYALLLYALVVVAVAVSLIRDSMLRRRLRFKAFIDDQKLKNEEYIYRSKMQFYTNISHEFRTPLTLIIGPINNLINKRGSGEDQKDSLYLLELIRNNSERMLRLVNELLSFRKAEVLEQGLCPINSDVRSLSLEIFESFTHYAASRDIDYRFKCDQESLNIDFDPEKLDKIIFNILSNAFKHNPDNIKINMTILNNQEFTPEKSYANSIVIGEQPEGDFVEIIISDSGCGMSSESLEKLFDRFFSGEENGLGIGMSMVKEFVVMHHAQLLVYSESGKGSCFRLILPQRQVETIVNDLTSSPLNALAPLSVEDIDLDSRLAEYSSSLILVVEDNIELLDYIASILGRYFKVSKAQNGVRALEHLELIEPDIVISDVVMPQMSGNELCKTIKSDIQTSHLPVILLTALDSTDNQIVGLNSGADAYIAKPFDERLLLTQVLNLLESRRELRAVFTTKSDLQQLNSNNHIVDLDKRFIAQATSYIEQNMANYDISVDTLAAELNISRTTLHRKLKSLTGLSGTEFMRNIRLKSAAKLLQAGEHRISEIGYIVGFNSPQYFTSSFTKLYGVSPTEFIKRSSSNE